MYESFVSFRYLLKKLWRIVINYYWKRKSYACNFSPCKNDEISVHSLCSSSHTERFQYKHKWIGAVEPGDVGAGEASCLYRCHRVPGEAAVVKYHDPQRGEQNLHQVQ